MSCGYVCVCILTFFLLCSPVAGSKTETRVQAEEPVLRSVVSVEPRSGIIWTDSETRQTSETNRGAKTNKQTKKRHSRWTEGRKKPRQRDGERKHEIMLMSKDAKSFLCRFREALHLI